MEYDEHSTQVMNFVSGLVLGAVIGAGVALLTAPESGRRTRKRLRRAAGDVRDTATDRWDDLADEVKGRVDDAFKGARKRFSAS
jgi:gas vesicle protein